ncbi:MAG: nucleoside-diphosphate kinase [Dehalococcoidales bacterium]|nr:nucleoside-diphosphate kinase [Dehalococcoidales bacterium]
MEKSLVLVKPDAMERGLSGEIIKRIEEAGLTLIGIKMLHMDMALAERHYAPHKDKPFFKSLTGYISSAPIVAAVFEGEGAVDLIRKLMGATDPAKAAEGTIRGDLGVDIEHNSIHGSDSTETAKNEINLFFKKAELFTY